MATLTKFLMSNVNAFPVANARNSGWELVSEYNLRTLDSVLTSESVKYFIGPSYVHSESDFYVTKQKADTGYETSSDTLSISAGRAIINGHYFESVTPVTVSMTDINVEEKKRSRPTLKGRLAIGLRAMYSTLPTLAGSMLTTGVEPKDMYFEGVQVVVLPYDQMITPEKSPNDIGKVTCHILLASFTYTNGVITGEIDNNYPGKCAFFPTTRLSDPEGYLSSIYITKQGMNPKQLYVFSTKGDPTTKNTWCQATDSLMVWDNNPTLVTEKPVEKEASFSFDSTGKTFLVMPHKQVDGVIDSNGTPQFYKTKTTPLPLADYVRGTPGTVDKNYTEHVKEVERKIREIYLLPAGKQRGFYESIESADDLPPIGPTWIPGDYIIVGEDRSVSRDEMGTTRSPSTMYVVLPGLVQEIKAYTQFPSSTPPTGIRLGYKNYDECNGVTAGSAPDKTTQKTYFGYFGIPDDKTRGLVDQDYFEITVPSTTDVSSTLNHYYYTVSKVGAVAWSDPIWLTGEIPLATTSSVGGFYNVSDTALGNGYVYLDDSGHLRMLDYDLLATGVAAYRLGDDMTLSGTAEEIQEDLNEMVNQRIAFPSLEQNYKLQTDTEFTSKRTAGTNANVINLTLDFSSGGTVTVEDIDCRFNTSVCLTITGDTEDSVTVNIFDCQKIRVINKLQKATLLINLARSCIYYDPDILDITTIVDGLGLWYERWEDTDPKLEINGLTVREIDTPVSVEELEFWDDEEAVNDNHYLYALHSITFGSDGTIIGCELIVRNETTANIDNISQVVVAKFSLPTGVGLRYPVTKMTKQLKITGSFVTAYEMSDPKGWKVIDTNFTALTNTIGEDGSSVDGVIAFYAKIEDVTNTVVPENLHSIDAWDSNSFHIFSGGALT